ncbi:hypothetical protein N657DRAFT_12364 [Parathielavia appendiculata]|uniref:Secreted protein n=1 Tax=Parathielavia appendiculata TaxID=2587402 RepID=A0AAN6Z8K7_9PEZI|nr:hypothetical protein N657DRAFT_12364 [Parathielavia appendiculata]
MWFVGTSSWFLASLTTRSGMVGNWHDYSPLAVRFSNVATFVAPSPSEPFLFPVEAAGLPYRTTLHSIGPLIWVRSGAMHAFGAFAAETISLASWQLLTPQLPPHGRPMAAFSIRRLRLHDLVVSHALPRCPMPSSLSCEREAGIITLFSRPTRALDASIVGQVAATLREKAAGNVCLSIRPRFEL